MQNINILTLGSPEGKGVFFPLGLLGAIVTPTGYNASIPANNDFPRPPDTSGVLDIQVSALLWWLLASHCRELKPGPAVSLM